MSSFFISRKFSASFLFFLNYYVFSISPVFSFWDSHYCHGTLSSTILWMFTNDSCSHSQISVSRLFCFGTFSKLISQHSPACLLIYIQLPLRPEATWLIEENIVVAGKRNTAVFRSPYTLISWSRWCGNITFPLQCGWVTTISHWLPFLAILS